MPPLLPLLLPLTRAGLAPLPRSPLGPGLGLGLCLAPELDLAPLPRSPLGLCLGPDLGLGLAWDTTPLLGLYSRMHHFPHACGRNPIPPKRPLRTLDT